MTPRENFLKTLHGEPHEFVPIELYGFWLKDRAALAEVKDPRRRRIGERIIDRAVFRSILPSHVSRYFVMPPQRVRETTEDLPGGHRLIHGVIDTPRGKLTYEKETAPESDTVWTHKYPVADGRDIEAIASVPWELPEEIRPCDGSERVGDFEGRGICETGISSPMVCVAEMMGFEPFLLLCATDLELVKRLTQVCLERAMACLEVLLSKPGVDLVWLGGSEWVTPPMGSPALYDALVQEQERAIVDYVHAHSSAVVQVHCHGKVRRALAQTIARGVDYTEPVEPPPDGDITMREAKSLAAGRITLGGNVEQRVMCNESEATVDRAARAAFEGPNGRFVLVTTAGVSPTVSDRELRNYLRLIDVWEELSPL